MMVDVGFCKAVNTYLKCEIKLLRLRTSFFPLKLLGLGLEFQGLGLRLELGLGLGLIILLLI